MSGVEEQAELAWDLYTATVDQYLVGFRKAIVGQDLSRPERATGVTAKFMLQAEGDPERLASLAAVLFVLLEEATRVQEEV